MIVERYRTADSTDASKNDLAYEGETIIILWHRCVRVCEGENLRLNIVRWARRPDVMVENKWLGKNFFYEYSYNIESLRCEFICVIYIYDSYVMYMYFYVLWCKISHNVIIVFTHYLLYYYISTRYVKLSYTARWDKKVRKLMKH